MEVNNKKSLVVKNTESTQITKGIVPKTFSELIQISKLIKSAPKFLPKSKVNYSVEELAVNIQIGLELGLTVMQAIQGIMIVNGAASVWGDYMIGLVLASGKLKSINEWPDGSFLEKNYVARCRVVRHGIDSSAERSFSMDDAIKAGLWAKNEIWKKFPKRMLSMRARSWALRDMFGDVLKGLVAIEESVDYSNKDEQAIIKEIEATGYQEQTEQNEESSDHVCGCSGGCDKQEPPKPIEEKPKPSSKNELTALIKEKLIEVFKDEKSKEEIIKILCLKNKSTGHGYTMLALVDRLDSFVSAYCKRSGKLNEEVVHFRAKTNFKTFWQTFYGWLEEQYEEQHSENLFNEPMFGEGE